MKRLLTAAAFALCLACAAPVAADAPWPPGITAGPGLCTETATWAGGRVVVADANCDTALLRAVRLMPPNTPAEVDALFVPGLGYDGRLGG